MLNPLNLLSKFIKSSNQRELDKLEIIVNKVNNLEKNISNLKDEEFPKKTLSLKNKIQSGEDLNNLLPEAFALVREASRRTREESHFDVQIMGGIILHRGSIAEMRTGEGKTLVSTMPIILNAMTGRGVHIITVNDYLAERDSQWMAILYNFLGLSVGCILNQMDNELISSSLTCELTFSDTNKKLNTIINLYSLIIN